MQLGQRGGYVQGSASQGIWREEEACRPAMSGVHERRIWWGGVGQVGLGECIWQRTEGRKWLCERLRLGMAPPFQVPASRAFARSVLRGGGGGGGAAAAAQQAQGLSQANLGDGQQGGGHQHLRGGAQQAQQEVRRSGRFEAGAGCIWGMRSSKSSGAGTHNTLANYPPTHPPCQWGRQRSRKP
jgi:hypothetical protein